MATPASWQLALARIDGALPFISPEVAEILAFRSLRRMWHCHVRDFPFEGLGPEHNPGLEATELARTWYAQERAAFLSWIARHATSPMRAAAQVALATRLGPPSPAPLSPATAALERLDALLPTGNPLDAITSLVEALSAEEPGFLEGDPELRIAGGRAFTAAAPRGDAWALSLVIAARPQLFALGVAPLALAGVARRELFRPRRERASVTILDEALDEALAWLTADVAFAAQAAARAKAVSARFNASSHAAAAYRLIAGLGPLTRIEIARGLAVSARTASLSVGKLEELSLAHLRPGDKAVVMNAGTALHPTIPRKPQIR